MFGLFLVSSGYFLGIFLVRPLVAHIQEEILLGNPFKEKNIRKSMFISV